MLSARKGMNYVSAELMRARDAAGYSSYCERLYAEGLEDLEKKKLKVRRSWSNYCASAHVGVVLPDLPCPEGKRMVCSSSKSTISHRHIPLQ